MSNFTLSDEYVTDTVGLVIYLENRRLGTEAQQVFEAAEKGQTVVHIPAMVLAEVLYLSEKNRIATNLTDVFHLLKNVPSFREFPMTGGVLDSAAEIDDIPDLHDRLISAGARLLNLDLVTNDSKIEASAFVNTVW